MKWLLVLLITISSFQASAHAIMCTSYAKIASTLSLRYQEEITHRGYLTTVDNKIFIVEIWQTKDKETFSIVQIGSSGVACLVMTGRELNSIKDVFNEPT